MEKSAAQVSAFGMGRQIGVGRWQQIARKKKADKRSGQSGEKRQARGREPEGTLCRLSKKLFPGGGKHQIEESQEWQQLQRQADHLRDSFALWPGLWIRN